MPGDKAKKRDNYYLILEIDPSIDDEKTIRAAIQNKKKAWSRDCNVPGPRGRLAGNYLRITDDIERIMLNPQMRKQEAENAIKIRKERLQENERLLNQAIGVFERRGYWFESDIIKLAKEYKLTEEEVRRRINVEIRPNPSQRPDISRRIEKINNNLPQGKKDLYDYIGMTQADSRKKLYDRCSEIYQNATAKKDNFGQTLAGEGLVIFADNNQKKVYDDYIKYRHIYEAIDQLGSSDTIPANSVEDFLKRIIEGGLSREEAMEIFKAYCDQKKYNYVLPIHKGEPDIICGFCNKVLYGISERCTNCGELLRIQCPKCSTQNSTSNKICQKCGLDFNRMKVAMAKKNDAKKYLNDFNLKEADIALDEAIKLWPGNLDIESLKNELQGIRADLSKQVSAIQEKIREKLFFAARQDLNLLTRRFPKYQNVLLENQIKTNLQSAEAWFKRAQNSSIIDEKIKFCLSALGICKDYEGAAAVVRAHPPAPPNALQTTCSANEVVLRWTRSESFGVESYKVVRKENAIPRNPLDGTVLIDTNNMFYKDTGLKTAVPMYYSVFAIRGGIPSTPLSTPTAATVFREVTNLKFIPGENNVTISWQIDSAAKEVEIWRGESRAPSRRGEGTKLSGVGKTSYDDANLRSNQKYGYLVITVYSTVNGKVYTDGVRFECTTMSLPDPVRNIVVSQEASGHYVLKWDAVSRGSVQVYYSLSRMHITDKVMPLTEIEGSLTRLAVSERKPDSCKFNIPAEVVYIYPVTILNSIGIVGEEARITALLEVENVTHDIKDRRLSLEFSWPKNAKEIVVLYKLGKYPTGITDRTANTKTISRPGTKFEINNIEKNDYCFMIFANYGEREPLYSSGRRFLVANSPLKDIYYTVKSDKTLLGKHTGIEITLWTDWPIENCPEILVVKKANSLPLNKNDGNMVYTLSNCFKGKKYKVKINDSVVGRKTYYRLFFNNPDFYKSFNLVCPDTKSCMITG